MIEKDRETMAREAAAQAADADIRSRSLSPKQKQECLRAYVQSWTHTVTYQGVSRDGQPYRASMETIVLPSSKIVMGLSREHFGDRLTRVQQDSIRAEYQFLHLGRQGKR